MDKYKVFEMSEELLAEVLSTSAEQKTPSVQIKGQEGQDAVLCSRNKTYSVRLVENSDTLLITGEAGEYVLADTPLDDLPPDDPSKTHSQRTVTGQVSWIYCLEETKPQFRAFRQLPAYKGSEGVDADAKKITTAELNAMVQTSDAQMQAGQQQENVCEIGGFWYVVEEGYYRAVVDAVFNAVLAKELNMEALSAAELIAEVQEHHADVVKHVLVMLSVQTPTRTDSGDLLFALDSAKVCRFVAQCLLRAGPLFEDELLEQWKDQVPFGMEPDLAVLSGMALSASVPTGVAQGQSILKTQWKYFPRSELSGDAKTRFTELFQAKQRWTLAEIAPYVREVLQPGQTLDACLLKYSRALRNKRKSMSGRMWSPQPGSSE
jgi:sister chromatid cohesion protein DCC1